MIEKKTKGFIEFIRKQGVVGLAIGFLLGGAVSKLVNSLVNDLINPIIGLVLGPVEALQDFTVAVGSSTIKVGSFVSNLLDFVIIAGVVYFVFKGLGLQKLDAEEGE
ncbi:large conductance mechanosensitive channel protein MscL [candidate division WWE3 bacterium]|nr:large conductance mechanosensitive channel protein MscL [candidate division WWE3 bacterium]